MAVNFARLPGSWPTAIAGKPDPRLYKEAPPRCNRMTAQDRGLTGDQISALAGCPDGCTEAALKANGFTIGLLGGLIRAGLATATPGMVKAGGRTLGVVRLAITEKGRTIVVR
jgi:uncharacterized metal-binding protein